MTPSRPGIYDELPKPIRRCYTQLCKNKTTIAVQDVMEALPSILCYANEQIDQSPNDKQIRSIVALANFAKNKIDTLSDAPSRTAVETALQDVCKKLEACSNLMNENSTQNIVRAAALDECCETLQTDIASSQNTILEAIGNLCAPTPLTQANVVAGVLTLTQTGNYIFCSDITATLLFLMVFQSTSITILSLAFSLLKQKMPL